MSSHAGKTAPRLIQDLLTYDPRHEFLAGRNLLTTAPPHHDPDAAPTRAVPERNCRHSLMIKNELSALPEGDPEVGTRYRIACYCQTCRWHFDLFVDSQNSSTKRTPCMKSSQEYVLHHFLFTTEDATSDANAARTSQFRCSAPQCPVELGIRVRPPLLNDLYVNLLTDKTLLKKRWEKAKLWAGDRADLQMARPIDALDYLTTYLTDCLNPQKGKARIPLLNKKFLKTFGKDCDVILNELGFEYKCEVEEDGSKVEAWYLPAPPADSDPLLPDTESAVIRDALCELSALMLSLPEHERTNTRRPVMAAQPALHLIERALACEGYQKKPLQSTRSASSEEEHPYYAGLGAVGDFSDALLLFAFSCQNRVDEANSPYYFECLQAIAIGRNSEVLDLQVQILASQGYTNRQEVARAYQYIGMDPDRADVVTDENIIGQFRSRISNIGPADAEESRNALRVIAFARKSDKIRQEAANAIENYEQALAWLDLDDHSPDEFVMTMFTIKAEEGTANRETARKAVQIIAEHRRSETLQSYLDTGCVPKSTEMDVGEAYALLDIPDRTSELDLDTLRETVTVVCSEKPENKEMYERAYRAICEDQARNFVTYNSAVQSSRTDRPLASWPVGCMNNGNTCYLNSVLQFLFTVKPLRDMVLDCEAHFQDTSPQALQTKKVGRCEVTPERVELAQQFMQELKHLFQQMITANSDRVRPDLKLAALALTKADLTKPDKPTENSAQEEGPQPALGHIEGLPVAGPAPYQSPTHPISHIDGAPIDDLVLDDAGIHGSNPSSTAVEAGTDGDQEMADAMTENPADTPNPAEPPARPPPAVPPRPLDLKKIEGLAQQQDAAEILNNIFDLLSCAIRAEDTIENGEQMDLIKKLFFSEVTTVHYMGGETTSVTSLKDHHLVSPGNRDRPLTAALDDDLGFEDFESAKGDVITKFEYLARAPPILIINVRRLLYEKGQPKLDTSRLGLDDVLYLDRYLKRTASLTEDELQHLRKNQWQLQLQLQSLMSRKGLLQVTDEKLSLPDAVDETADLIEDVNQHSDEVHVDQEENTIPVYTELPAALRSRADELRKELDDIDGHIQQLDREVGAVFEQYRDHPYRLHAVFMHRGGAKGGHYWIYIHDSQNKVWRSYNDETVEEVDAREIFERSDSATSTGIVYVRDNEINELTEPLCRRPPSEMTGTANKQSGETVPVIQGIPMDDSDMDAEGEEVDAEGEEV